MHPEIEFQSRFAQAGGASYHGHEGVRLAYTDRKATARRD
jgi:hypothetical protein